ncbi:hypothetical protein CYMTET_51845 [Cymbomonas tetramitiformis]|uniref:Uncharacterized protein n=1 Tax=Cymbomonas tetramitiformis TaxID=36881 RepID=A0AAE0BK69_9CHLO|nr:hypothetical protein CYMTET_51845 [Cymbomonas tetramitiformis]
MADAIKYEDWASTKELAAKIGRVLTTEFVEPQLREHGTVGFKYVDDRQAEEYLSTLEDQGVGTKQYVSLMETLAKESYISKFYNNYDWIQVSSLRCGGGGGGLGGVLNPKESVHWKDPGACWESTPAHILVITAMQAALAKFTQGNHRPKARALAHFCEGQGLPWLPAAEESLLLYMGALLRRGTVAAGSMQP